MRRTLGFIATASLMLGGMVLVDAGASGATPEAALTGVAQITAGGFTTCARLTNGQARCWGLDNHHQLGDGGTSTSTAPVTVLDAGGASALTGITQIDSGNAHSCARLTSGQVRCWGNNLLGALGDGTNTDPQFAVVVRNSTNTGPLTNVAQVTVGSIMTCARLANGQVRCWGNNTNGSLGRASTASSFLPVAVRAVSGAGNLTGVVQIEAAAAHVCARLNTGQARCWGENGAGETGDGTTTTPRTRPRAVRAPTGAGNLTNVTNLSTGRNSSCAVLNTGQARCWGLNDEGQLGDNTVANRKRPVVVKSPSGAGPLTNVTQISTGDHTCARLGSGQVRCWGENSARQTGDGTFTSPRLLPVTVQAPGGGPALTGATQVSVGNFFHSCARLNNGEARCWGQNGSAELGAGDTAIHQFAVEVQA